MCNAPSRFLNTEVLSIQLKAISHFPRSACLLIPNLARTLASKGACEKNEGNLAALLAISVVNS
jgi:hypothetical protein